MYISVALGGHSPNLNANSRRKSTIPGTAEKYSETCYMQSPEEHRALLEKYKGVKGMPAALAEALGEEEERRSPRYWKTDTQPRYGGSTPSSSFIQGINVSPGLNIATITMKNGRSYSYPLTTEQAGELTNANSLGAWYNKNIKLGRSKIPVSVDARSGNLSGPDPIVLGGSGRSGKLRLTNTSGGNVAEAILPLGIRALGSLAKLIK